MIKWFLTLVSCFSFKVFATDLPIFFIERGQTEINKVLILKDPPAFLSEPATLAKVPKMKKSRGETEMAKDYVFSYAIALHLFKDDKLTYIATYLPREKSVTVGPRTCWITAGKVMKFCEFGLSEWDISQIYVDLDGDGILERIVQIGGEELPVQFRVQTLNPTSLRYDKGIRFLPVAEAGPSGEFKKYELLEEDFSSVSNLALEFPENGKVLIHSLPIHCYSAPDINTGPIETMHFPLVLFKKKQVSIKENLAFIGPPLKLVAFNELQEAPKELLRVTKCSKDSDCKIVRYADGFMGANQSFVLPKFCRQDPGWTNFKGLSSFPDLNASERKPSCVENAEKQKFCR
ncbi:MAG: hypothetical protein ACXVA9_00530 [Bdellovibrionales bacterium]